MRKIKTFLSFILESSGESTYRKYDLREDLEWNEEIVAKIDTIEELAGSIRNDYEWNRHGRDYRGDGFEFKIKARNFPDIDGIAKKYETSEEEVWDLWNDFLNDNLSGYADGYVEDNSNLFKEWFQAGRSGGWLVLISELGLDEDRTQELIQDDLHYAIDAASDLSEEDIKVLNFQYKYKDDEGKKKGFELLASLKISDLSDDAKYYLKRKDETLEALESMLNEYTELEKKLENIQKDIDNFWENAPKNFTSWAEEEIQEINI
jgi:hypothetical protein